MSKLLMLHQRLVERDISAQELARLYLSMIKRDNGALGAYVNITEEVALKAAKRVDEKIARGEKISLLAGIPMALKDNISTKGIETTCCSKILKGYKPIYNATAWEKLVEKDAVLLGKTNMDEFAMGSTCEHSCFFPSRNPHNIERIPGGSSGGSASAVAGNLAVYALGSDTGGSVRYPASLCGIVGLKPTYGAISRSGLIAFASSLDQVGIMAQYVSDVAAVFDRVAGGDILDSTSNPKYEAHTFNTLKNDIKGKKIGVPRELCEGLSKDVRKAFANTLKVYEGLGAEIVHINLPELEYTMPIYCILACAEASSNLGRYDGVRFGCRPSLYEDVNDMIAKARSEGFGDEVKRRILMGTYVLSKGYRDAYYKKAQGLRECVVAAFRRAFETLDVMLTPTAPATAQKIGEMSQNPVENYKADICTVAANITGLPAVSVPCGFDKEGLPIGVQLIGKAFEESVILNFANKFQEATDFVKETDWGVRL